LSFNMYMQETSRMTQKRMVSKNTETTSRTALLQHEFRKTVALLSMLANMLFNQPFACKEQEYNDECNTSQEIKSLFQTLSGHLFFVMAPGVHTAQKLCKRPERPGYA